VAVQLVIDQGATEVCFQAEPVRGLAAQVGVEHGDVVAAGSFRRVHRQVRFRDQVTGTGAGPGVRRVQRDTDADRERHRAAVDR
jgi:hypothetical protein